MVLLLFLVLIASLIIIPLGLPGIWLMVIAAAAYDFLVPGDPVGWVTIVGVAVIATIAEILEFMLAGRYTRKFGGSRRAGWWAIFGGIIGAMVGIPIPLIGSMIGAFAGAFAGAWLAEITAGKTASDSTRVATGALLGRVTASALKVAIGGVMIVWILVAALMGVDALSRKPEIT